VPLTFGHLPGYPPGSTFPDRDAVKAAGLHSKRIDGISSLAAETGADAIVLNGGYPDDDDRGEEVIYSGEGGRTGSRRTGHQTWTKGNEALRESWATGRPVRVIRGPRLKSAFRPTGVYRYDGLYQITDAWRAPGIDGYETCFLRLVRLPGDTPPWQRAGAPTIVGKSGAPDQSETVVRRAVRDTKVTRWVKQRHKNACQICGKVVDIGGAAYSEGAHVRPLGKTHGGPDRSDNVLCLCPECHVLLDYGAVFITPGMEVFDRRHGAVVAPLRTHLDHELDPAHLTYHREKIAGQA
jgi:predicted restriction endonuclease